MKLSKRLASIFLVLLMICSMSVSASATDHDGSISIDASLCNGCGLCKEMCHFGAIKGGER